MNEQPQLGKALIREIARYLAAVDAFRAEHCEPTWLPESTTRSYAEPPVRSSSRRRDAHLAH
jgi:hypothetical protein